MLLKAYHSVRGELAEVAREDMPRRVTGALTATAANLNHLQNLQENGHLDAIHPDSNRAIDLSLDKANVTGQRLLVTLKPSRLHHYEDLDELLATTTEEPAEYVVHGLGPIKRGEPASEKIRHYRDCLAARDFLSEIAELPEPDRVIFFTPKKLEIRFEWSAAWLRELKDLPSLRSDFADESPDSEQRLILFKRNLREYLHAHPVPDRFSMFIQNFGEIVDSYRKDYELWLNNAFSEIKKGFEERRLKFVTELGNILNGIQASILAVPLAAAVIGDKFDLSDPLRNFLLAVAVFFVAFIALKLLRNQDYTLAATESAIEAVKLDYGTRQRNGSLEFDTRMGAIVAQATRVRKLLRWFLLGNFIICGGVAAFWLVSYFHWRWPAEKWSPFLMLAATLAFFYVMRRWWMTSGETRSAK